MALRKSFIPEFTEFIPSNLEEGVLYISIPYSTASHKCACGCGLVVVTPFSDPDWDLIYNRDGVSLDPSIGNWSFPCESHYWIRKNRVQPAPKWSKERIAAARAFDASRKVNYFEKQSELKAQDEAVDLSKNDSFWGKVKKALFGSQRK